MLCFHHATKLITLDARGTTDLWSDLDPWHRGQDERSPKSEGNRPTVVHLHRPI